MSGPAFQGNLECVQASEPKVIHSAYRHGVTKEDMLHAWRNVMWVHAMEDDLQMWIGPAQTAQILEIGIVEGDEGPVIVHAMNAREKFLYRR